MRKVGLTLLGLFGIAALVAGWLGPHAPDRQLADLLYAPPTRVHLVDADGTWRAPFIYPWRLVSRLERRFEEDRSRPVPLRWLSGGHLVASADDGQAPLLLLGADGFGRDVFSRLLFGARISLALALAATTGAMLLGLLIGGAAGYAGGVVDEALSRVSDFVLVLPATYVVLALRAVMPLTLPAGEIFMLMTGIFALVGWPFIARGVRAIVASEGAREYAEAARAVGAKDARVLFRHLLPATTGFLAVQCTLLLPAFILAEATMSYVGLGFADRTPSWGTMLHDASNVAMLGDAPWALAPAAAIFVVVLAVNLVFESPSTTSRLPPAVSRIGSSPAAGLSRVVPR